MIGIYKITNLVNGLVYIGQSINIHKRWANHRSRAFSAKSREYNIPLYQDFRKYGLENFEFKVIEECLKEELNDKEQYWIEYYDSFFNGYNESVGGAIHCRHSGISKEKIIGVITDLKTTTMIHSEIAKKWDISIEMVQGINTGRYWKHNTSYPIQQNINRYVNRYTNKNNNTNKKRELFHHMCKTCGDPFDSYDETQVYCSQECSCLDHRKVERPSKEELFELIKTTPFLTIGKMYNVSDNAVRKWCETYGLPYRKKDIKMIA